MYENNLRRVELWCRLMTYIQKLSPTGWIKRSLYDIHTKITTVKPFVRWRIIRSPDDIYTSVKPLIRWWFIKKHTDMHTKQHPLCSSSHDELSERVMTYRQQLLYFSFVIHQSVPSEKNKIVIRYKRTR
jgi:hypothetical protein